MTGRYAYASILCLSLIASGCAKGGGPTGPGDDADADLPEEMDAPDVTDTPVEDVPADDLLDAPEDAGDADDVIDVLDEEIHDVVGDDGPISCSDHILNGDFSLFSTGWTAAGSSTISTGAPGHLGPGEGRFPGRAICDMDTISQRFAVPAIGDCGPAKLVLWAHGLDAMGMGISPWLATGIAGNWYFTDDFRMDTWKSASVCLGEAAYGGWIDLVFSSAYAPSGCETSPSGVVGLGIDDVAVVFDSSCPAVGEVPNGDLEAGDGSGWSTFSTGSAVADTAATGEGVGGSYGARVTLAESCTEARMWVPMSVPLPSTIANPALVFQANLDPGVTARVDVRDTIRMNLAGTGSFETVSICLPHLVSGGVYDVIFGLASSGTCSLTLGWDFVMDDVQVMNETACLSASGLLDPGFEQSILDSNHRWVMVEHMTGTGGSPIAEALNDVSRSRTGDASGHISIDKRCDSATLRQAITVPAPVGTSGPAVVFWYSHPSAAETNLSFWVSALGDISSTLDWATGTATTGYSRQVLCMPPHMAGRPAIIEVAMGAGGLCADMLPAREHAFVDDFEVTTDSSCPAT